MRKLRLLQVLLRAWSATCNLISNNGRVVVEKYCNKRNIWLASQLTYLLNVFDKCIGCNKLLPTQISQRLIDRRADSVWIRNVFNKESSVMMMSHEVKVTFVTWRLRIYNTDVRYDRYLFYSVHLVRRFLSCCKRGLTVWYCNLKISSISSLPKIWNKKSI